MCVVPRIAWTVVRTATSIASIQSAQSRISGVIYSARWEVEPQPLRLVDHGRVEDWSCHLAISPRRRGPVRSSI